MRRFTNSRAENGEVNVDSEFIVERVNATINKT